MSVQIDASQIVGLSEVRELEELFSDEVRCESRGHIHGNRDSVPCSVEVTHRSVECRVSRLLCFNAARRAVELMDYPLTTCRACGRRASECWSIHPV